MLRDAPHGWTWKHKQVFHEISPYLGNKEPSVLWINWWWQHTRTRTERGRLERHREMLVSVTSHLKRRASEWMRGHVRSHSGHFQAVQLRPDRWSSCHDETRVSAFAWTGGQGSSCSETPRQDGHGWSVGFLCESYLDYLTSFGSFLSNSVFFLLNFFFFFFTLPYFTNKRLL